MVTSPAGGIEADEYVDDAEGFLLSDTTSRFVRGMETVE